MEAIASFENAGFPRDAILHYYPDYEAELPLIKRAQDLFRGTPPTQALTVARMVDRLRMAKRLSKSMAAATGESEGAEVMVQHLATQRSIIVGV